MTMGFEKARDLRRAQMAGPPSALASDASTARPESGWVRTPMLQIPAQMRGPQHRSVSEQVCPWLRQLPPSTSPPAPPAFPATPPAPAPPAATPPPPPPAPTPPAPCPVVLEQAPERAIAAITPSRLCGILRFTRSLRPAGDPARSAEQVRGVPHRGALAHGQRRILAVGAGRTLRRAGREELAAVGATETGRPGHTRLPALGRVRGADALHARHTRRFVELDRGPVVRRRRSLGAAAGRVHRIALRFQALIRRLLGGVHSDELALPAAVGLMPGREAVRCRRAGSVERQDRLAG